MKSQSKHGIPEIIAALEKKVHQPEFLMGASALKRGNAQARGVFKAYGGDIFIDSEVPVFVPGEVYKCKHISLSDFTTTHELADFLGINYEYLLMMFCGLISGRISAIKTTTTVLSVWITSHGLWSIRRQSREFSLQTVIYRASSFPLALRSASASSSCTVRESRRTRWRCVFWKTRSRAACMLLI